PALTHNKICVGSGTACPRSAKMVANRGMTNVMRKTMAPMPNVKAPAGEGAARLQDVGEPPQRELEDAAPLAGANHVDVEARERPGMMLGERLAQGRAAADAHQQAADARLDALV